MSILAAFMSGFTLAFGIGTGEIACAWFSLAFIMLAGFLSWCENREG
jgi:hypothetical protein